MQTQSGDVNGSCHDSINGNKFVRTETEVCPICGSDNGIGRRLAGAVGGSVYLSQCRQCHIGYQNPKPTPEATLTQQNFGWKRTDVNYCKPAEAMARATRQCQIIAEVAKTPGKLLDLGAGIGTFVMMARKAGWQACGTERCDSAIERARLENGVELTKDIPSCEYDMVTLWDVIEHLRKPGEILELLRKFLKPGGKIILETGNYESWPHLQQGDKWTLYQMDHLYYFTPTSLSALLKKTGFGNFRLLKNFNKRVPRWRELRSPISYLKKWNAFLKGSKLWPEENCYEVMVVAAEKM